MENLSLKIIFILLVVNQTTSLESSDICSISAPECRQDYNLNEKTNKICEQIKCAADLKYRCTRNHCSTDNQTCKRFFSMNSFVKSMQRVQLYQREVSHFKKFINGITNCSHVDYVFEKSDACLNSQMCIYKEVFTVRNVKHSSIKKKICGCVGNFGFKCSNEVCTIGKIACDHYLKTRNGSAEFKQCLNGKRVFNKKLSLF